MSCVTILFSILANHNYYHNQAIRKVHCQPGDRGWPLYLPQWYYVGMDWLAYPLYHTHEFPPKIKSEVSPYYISQSYISTNKFISIRRWLSAVRVMFDVLIYVYLPTLHQEDFIKVGHLYKSNEALYHKT